MKFIYATKPFHFNTPQEVAAFFRSCGFGKVSLLQPSWVQHNPSGDAEAETQQHRGDLVWVIAAQR